MSKSDLNSSMLFKIRDGRLCVMLYDDKKEEMFFYDKDYIKFGEGAVVSLEALNEELLLTENNTTSYDIIAMKQYSNCVKAISMVLEDEEPEVWDWVREEIKMDKHEWGKVEENNNNKNIVNNYTFNITIDPRSDMKEVAKKVTELIEKDMRKFEVC